MLKQWKTITQLFLPISLFLNIKYFRGLKDCLQESNAGGRMKQTAIKQLKVIVTRKRQFKLFSQKANLWDFQGDLWLIQMCCWEMDILRFTQERGRKVWSEVHKRPKAGRAFGFDPHIILQHPLSIRRRSQPLTLSSIYNRSS